MGNSPKIYGLSHESIISIDIKNKNVVALIKHEHYVIYASNLD